MAIFDCGRNYFVNENTFSKGVKESEKKNYVYENREVSL